jgi:GTP-sensing pleiotropic transcriptional regulator CodY
MKTESSVPKMTAVLTTNVNQKNVQLLVNAKNDSVPSTQIINLLTGVTLATTFSITLHQTVSGYSLSKTVQNAVKRNLVSAHHVDQFKNQHVTSTPTKLSNLKMNVVVSLRHVNAKKNHVKLHVILQPDKFTIQLNGMSMMMNATNVVVTKMALPPVIMKETHVQLSQLVLLMKSKLSLVKPNVANTTNAKLQTAYAQLIKYSNNQHVSHHTKWNSNKLTNQNAHVMSMNVFVIQRCA